MSTQKCRNIVSWDSELDFEGFSESALKEIFPNYTTKDVREWKKRRFNLRDFYQRLGLCVYDLFPETVDVWQIPGNILSIFKNVYVSYFNKLQYSQGCLIKAFERDDKGKIKIK